LNNPLRLIDISGLSAQEASRGVLRLATSDISWLHNTLISLETLGLARASQASQSQVASVGGFAGGVWSVTKGIGSFVVDNLADLSKLALGGLKGLGTSGTINPISVGTDMGIIVLEDTPTQAQIWAVDHPKAVQANRASFVSGYKAAGYSFDEAWDLYISYNVRANKEKFTAEWNNTPN
jgi:hypothetical protein